MITKDKKIKSTLFSLDWDGGGGEERVLAFLGKTFEKYLFRICHSLFEGKNFILERAVKSHRRIKNVGPTILAYSFKINKRMNIERSKITLDGYRIEGELLDIRPESISLTKKL